MNRKTYFALALHALWSLGLSPAYALAQDTPTFSEYAVKAAYIYMLTLKTSQAEVMKKSGDMEVCVVGKLDKAIIQHFTDAYESKNTLDVKPRLSLKSGYSDIGSCSALFISESEAGNLDAILEALKGKHILTVSDMNGFARRGGMVELVVKESRVKFIVNKGSIASTGMSVDPQVLAVALSVIG